MRKVMALILTLVFVLGLASFAAADWEKCKACHNGKVAPDEAAMKAKFKTADEFVKAAMTSPNAMMKSQQGDEEVLKKTAAALGFK
ncbi:MAG: hypothetical protein L3V56_10660 [Candidatus Magnetoovum sp. WYHC-5]|nr:hypothetical protein [Candidatus Magnetoovum sp. WYHC-5]